MGASFGCFPGVRPGDGDPPLPGPAAAVKGVEVEAERDGLLGGGGLPPPTPDCYTSRGGGRGQVRPFCWLSVSRGN